MKKSLYSVFLFIALLAFTAPSAYPGAWEDCAEHLAYAVPSGDAPGQTALCRAGYFALHDDARKTPAWVAEHLTATRASSHAVARADRFRADPDLPKASRAELGDYAGSGYDRGHMAPAADNKWSADAMRECFYLSNMVPQRHAVNDGAWKQIEAMGRRLAVAHGEAYIYSGPIFGSRMKGIGQGRVAVPIATFKIIAVPSTGETLAFIVPNTKRPKPAESYQSTLAAVEARTGLHFREYVPEVGLMRERLTV